MPSEELHATFDATNHPRAQVHGIRHRRGRPPASRRRATRSVAPRAHLTDMSNHAIAPHHQLGRAQEQRPRGPQPAEVAALLTLDPRTVDHAIEDGTIPAVHVGRRVLIPRRPLLRAFGIDDEAPA